MEPNREDNQGERPRVSVIIAACDNPTYARLCIQSLLQHTPPGFYELITVANSRSGGTADYFNGLEHKKKITFTHASGSGTARAFNEGLRHADGAYILFSRGHVIFTPRWLDNLLACLEADEKTGMAVPACNQDVDCQQVGLAYGNVEELYEAARKYNMGMRYEWEERVKLTTYAFLAPTALLKALGGFSEAYFQSGYEEADLCFRMRRAGFKLMFAKNTYIHYFGSGTLKDKSIDGDLQMADSKRFYVKFRVDAAEAAIHAELIPLLEPELRQGGHKNILGIGASCGGTALQIKNRFKDGGNKDVTLWYLTEAEKYVADLETVCDKVSCAGFSEISALFPENRFDCILIDRDIRVFENPQQLLKDIKGILKADGRLIFYIENEAYYANIAALANTAPDPGRCIKTKWDLNPESLTKLLQRYGYSGITHHYINAAGADNSELMEKVRALSSIEDKGRLDTVIGSKNICFNVKGKTSLKTVLLYPGYDFFLDDAFFDYNAFTVQLGVDVGKSPFALLREELDKRGYRFCTIDRGELETADHVVFIDVPKRTDNLFYKQIYHQVYKGQEYFDRCLALKKKKNFKWTLFMQEPPFVMPENYDKSLHGPFDRIITFDDDLVDNKKYFKYILTEPEGVKNTYSKSFREKKLLTLIASNKRSDSAGELYGKRREMIGYFEKNHIGDFEFYGWGWENYGYKSYKGAVRCKLEALSRYKFCICYENGILNGWITEKLFDSFFSGCVPVYLGAPNISDYVPDGTYIDMRRFKDYEEMYAYICTIGEEAYQDYLDRIHHFLSSEAFTKFTPAFFTRSMINSLGL